ncbi:MAG: hypothetical protein KKG75_03390 [Nanoarchaeota archaeon]|nr:hypothetical protein [Nanoarchaeota archaeon]
MKGFILYPTYRVIDGKSYVWLFGKLENGESFLTMNKYEPYFYIRTKDSKKLLKKDSPKDYEIEDTNFKNFKGEKLSRVKLELPKEVPKVRRELEDDNVVCYEADVRFAQRYLIDKNIMMGIEIDGEYEIGEFVDKIYHEPSITPCDDFFPNLKVFSIDIETNRDAKKLYSIAVYSEGFEKVLMGEEEDMLEEFKKIIIDEDPDILTGWNFIDFDLDILKKKFKQHKIPFILGRINQACRLKLESNFFRDSKADFPGRIVLDGISLLRMSFVKLPSFKLGDVAYQILKEKKLIGDKNKVAEIERLFKEDKKKLKEYNLKDAKLVYDILKKIKAVEMVIEKSFLTGMPLDRVNASIASLDSLYLRELKKRGYAANSGSYSVKEERIKGGYVMESKPGIYDNVIILDFKSVDYSEPIYLLDNLNNVKIIPIGKFVDSCLNSGNKKYFKNLEIGMVPGDWKVLCFDKDYKVRYSKISQVSRHYNNEPLYEIITISGRTIKITKSHSLFSINNNFRPIPVKGSELKEGSSIVIPLKANLPLENNIEKNLNLLSLLRNIPKEKLKNLELCIESKHCLYKYKRRIKYLKAIYRRNGIAPQKLEQSLGLKKLCVYPVIRNLRKEGLISIDKGKIKLTLEGLSYYKNLSVICKSHKYNPATGLCSIDFLKSFKHINKEDNYFLKWKLGYKYTPSNSRIKLLLPLKPLCSLLGYFAAEGCCVKSRKKDRINQDHYKVNITARDLHKKIVNDCKKLGLRAYNKKEGFVTFSSKLMYFLFKHMFKTGVNAHNKKVPFFIFNQENKLKKIFLKSYFEGDGHLYSHAQQFATASEELVNGIALLNMGLGNLGFKIGKYKSYYHCFINNDIFSNRKLKRVNYAFRVPNKNIPKGFFEKNKREKYNKSINAKKLCSWLNSQNIKKHIFNGHLGIDTIKKIRKIKPTKNFVYDIGVNPNQNFICGRGGIVAHNSLYPSMMQTFNIDPLNYVEDCKGKNLITAPNGACFKNNNGIMGDIITKLLIARDKSKKEGNELQRWAIKILLNSFFGVIANPNCRFFNLNIANAITHFGQKLIKLTAEKVEEEGYEVIYMDTDSCFILSKVESLKEANEIGEKLNKKLNSFFNNYVKKEYNRESKLILEYEKCFTRFLMPKIRGSEEGAKKRYAGVNSKGKIEVTGMEFARSDWTGLAKKFQLELLKKVFEKKEVKGFIKKFVEGIRKGKYDELLIYRKNVRKELEMYTKITPPHIRAARKLKNFQGNVIEYIMTEDGPEPIENLKNKIDYEHYIDKQIKPIADSVLVFFDLSFDELLEGSTQTNLSGF